MSGSSSQRHRKTLSRRTQKRNKKRRATRRKRRHAGPPPPLPPDEISLELNRYTPYYLKLCSATTEEGKYVSIHPIDPDLYSPMDAGDEDWVARADAIFKKVLDEPMLVDQSDGIFTYFVYHNYHVQTADYHSHDDPDAIRLGCIKVRSGFEFGSSHMNLAEYLGLYSPEMFGSRIARFLFAGEFKKEGRSITYNFESGTFLRNHNSPLLPDELARIRSQRVKTMEYILAKYGLVGTYAEDSFITPKTPYFTLEEREDLKSLGLELKDFDTKRDCIKYEPEDEEDEEEDD
jgi:hypothetical protein